MAPPVAGYTIWLDASQIAGVADGASLTSWPDLSGNGWNFTTEGGISAPQFYKTTSAKLINGLPAVWFSSSGSILHCGTHQVTGTDGTWTVFAIGYDTGVNSPAFLLNADLSASSGTLREAQFLRHITGNLSTLGFNTAVSAFSASGGTPSTSAANLWEARHQTSSVDGRLNGVSIGSTATTGTNQGAATDVEIGERSPNGATSAWNGPICEVLIYPSGLTDPNVLSVESYLTNKWLVAPPPYNPPPTYRPAVPVMRASNWRGWTKRLSGLTVPGFADARLNILGA